MLTSRNGRSAGGGPGTAAARSVAAEVVRRGRAAAAEALHQASCPGSIRLARWKVNSSSPEPFSAATGSSRKASWSPASAATARGRRTSSGSRRGSARRPALVPGAARELVDLVAGLAAEQLGQRGRVLGHAVDAEQLGIAAAAVGAVVVREADREARRVDARLGREADQAAERLAAGAGGDDEHRVLEAADERVEGGCGVHADRRTRRAAPQPARRRACCTVGVKRDSGGT